MELDNYEERFFWKKIYVVAIRSGRAGTQAALEADYAVLQLRKTPVTRPT